MASPVYGWRTPAGSDAPNGPEQLLNLSADIEPHVIGQFASAVARDAAWPVGQRRAGMTAVIGSGSSMQVTIWDGDAWWPWESRWQAYTPTWNGISSLGNGVSGGQWRYRGGDVQTRMQLTVGSTTTFSPTAGIMIYPSLPTGALSPTIEVLPAWLFDSSSSEPSRWYTGFLAPTAYMMLGGTRLQTPSSPIALAANDLIRVAGSYQPTV